MIVIVVLLLISLYLFWRFEQQRKIRHEKHHLGKQEALDRLLTTLKANPPGELTNPEKEEKI